MPLLLSSYLCKIKFKVQQKQNKHKHTSSYSCLSVWRKEDSLYDDNVYKMCLLVYGIYLTYILLMETQAIYIG